MTQYFQDLLSGNHCFGCGPDSSDGLKIKSYWARENEALCEFIPEPQHCAAPTHFLNGGVIATIIDCHSICTAIAHAYKIAGHEIGDGKARWYATSKLDITYLRPASIASNILLKARVQSETDKTINVACSAYSDGKECASALVVAASVPESWMAS